MKGRLKFGRQDLPPRLYLVGMRSGEIYRDVTSKEISGKNFSFPMYDDQ